MNRSALVYVVAGLIAVGIGAGAAMLQPKPMSTSVELKAKADPKDPRIVREEALEALVADARGAEDVEALPGFDVALVLIGGDKHSWARERLAEADVPKELAVALARRVRKKGDGPARAEALLHRLLEAGDAEAVAAVRHRGEATTSRDLASRATFGLWRGWVVAWGEGLSWGPAVAGDDLVLHLAAGDARGLAMRLPEGVSAVVPRPDSEAKVATTPVP